MSQDSVTPGIPTMGHHAQKSLYNQSTLVEKADWLNKVGAWLPQTLNLKHGPGGIDYKKNNSGMQQSSTQQPAMI